MNVWVKRTHLADMGGSVTAWPPRPMRTCLVDGSRIQPTVFAQRRRISCFRNESQLHTCFSFLQGTNTGLVSEDVAQLVWPTGCFVQPTFSSSCLDCLVQPEAPLHWNSNLMPRYQSDSYWLCESTDMDWDFKSTNCPLDKYLVSILLRCDAASMQMGRNIQKQEMEAEEEKQAAAVVCVCVCVCVIKLWGF